MARNYGIAFCRKVLSDLKAIEDEMFRGKGHGFDMHSEAFRTELKYLRLLKAFERERELDLPPSYNPDVHGAVD